MKIAQVEVLYFQSPYVTLVIEGPWEQSVTLV